MTESSLQLQQRMYRETEKAYRAYMDYRGMGINRSLRKLHDTYTAPDAPRDCPTKNLSTIEGWSSKFQWQDRIAEYERHQYDNRESEMEKERYAERLKRAALLDRFREKIEKQMYMASLQDEVSIKAMTALTRAFKAYADVSMKHYNDLPTERKDLTSKGKEISVNFITEPVSQDMVDERLKALGLADLVDEQTE